MVIIIILQEPFPRSRSVSQHVHNSHKYIHKHKSSERSILGTYTSSYQPMDFQNPPSVTDQNTWVLYLSLSGSVSGLVWYSS